MKRLFLLLLLPSVAFAQTAPQEYKINGELRLAKPIDWVYLLYPADGKMHVDSVQTPNGDFKFEGKIKEPILANIRVKYVKQEGEEKPKVEAIGLYLEGQKINITAKDSLKNNKVTGSSAHADYLSIIEKQKPYMERMKPLNAQGLAYKKEKNVEAEEKIIKELQAIDKEMKENVFRAFVKNNPNSVIALSLLKQYAGFDIDVKVVEPLFAALPKAVQQWPSAVAFKELIEISKKTSVGMYAMNFTQNDTLGNPVSLSSFKGKYVLVDFWASWCGPCRKENPKIVKAFNQYKDKNFTVLGVSLDRPDAKEKWMKAIHDDNLTWTQVSDLKYWDNEVVKQYGIKAIPQNFLLDPEGKIIAKNLDGEELDKKLSEVLK